MPSPPPSPSKRHCVGRPRDLPESYGIEQFLLRPRDRPLIEPPMAAETVDGDDEEDNAFGDDEEDNALDDDEAQKAALDKACPSATRAATAKPTTEAVPPARPAPPVPPPPPPRPISNFLRACEANLWINPREPEAERGYHKWRVKEVLRQRGLLVESEEKRKKEEQKVIRKLAEPSRYRRKR